jgi:hypothetical protein
VVTLGDRQARFSSSLAGGGVNKLAGDRRPTIGDTTGDPVIREGALVDGKAIDAADRGLVSVKRYDIYATALDRSEARVFRVICGAVCFDIDAGMARFAKD